MCAPPAADPELTAVDSNWDGRRHEKQTLLALEPPRTREAYSHRIYSRHLVDGTSNELHRRSTANAVAVDEAALLHRLTVERMSGCDLDTRTGQLALAEMVALTESNMRAFSTLERPLSETESNLRLPGMHIIALRDGSLQKQNVVAFTAYRLDFFRDDQPAAYLYELQLAEHARHARPSLGKALIAEVEEHAALAGCTQVLFSVDERNKAAVGFYDKGCGYERVSQRDETGEDGCVVSIVEYSKACSPEAYALRLDDKYN